MNFCQIKNICHSYGEKEVLCSISSKVQAGEIIGIIGPNGGGKTTLIKILAGLLTPTRGSVNFTPTAVTGYVPQLWRVDRSFPLTLKELVLTATISNKSLGFSFCKSAHLRAELLLDDMGLRKEKDLLLHQASGGQLQRALLARALFNNPTLLLLDEATAQIDPDSRKRITKIISEKAKQQVTCILVSHHLNEIAHIADRIWCLQTTLEEMTPSKICMHHNLGLYHKPNPPGHLP